MPNATRFIMKSTLINGIKVRIITLKVGECMSLVKPAFGCTWPDTNDRSFKKLKNDQITYETPADTDFKYTPNFVLVH
jgi:hypothetical protein